MCTGKRGGGRQVPQGGGKWKEKEKNTTLQNILQLREAKTWEMAKIGQEPGIKDTGRGML